MPYLIAIESDPKCHKEIKENWADLTKELGHEVLLFKSLAEFTTEFEKADNVNKTILLILVRYEELNKADPTKHINELRAKHKCEILLSVFEDPMRPLKKSSQLPVRNIIYKPFDLTILKEHTRIALFHGQRVRTQFVHSTQVNAEIESLKKFRILQLSEFGFKLDKLNKLELNKPYKFYHPLFSNKKQQHIWAKLSSETDKEYELYFCQMPNTVLSQIRKKVATTSQKVKFPIWTGSEVNDQFKLTVVIQLNDEPTVKALEDLLNRNFKNITFVPSKDLDPKQKATIDVLITETEYEAKTIETQFTQKPHIIRVYDKDLTRHEVESRFEVEAMRVEKPLDRAYLVKIFKILFPALLGKEEIQRITVQMDELTSQSDVIKIQEFSEAAILFTDTVKHNIDEIMEIALPQDDEANLHEMKGKLHFVAEKYNNDKEKLYQQQMVLFGMKDEYLKIIRLWALQKYIERKK